MATAAVTGNATVTGTVIDTVTAARAGSETVSVTITVALQCGALSTIPALTTAQ